MSIRLNAPTDLTATERDIRWAWGRYDSFSVAEAAAFIRSDLVPRMPASASRAELLALIRDHINDYGRNCPVLSTLWVVVASQRGDNCDLAGLCNDIEGTLTEISGPDGVLTPDDVVAYYNRQNTPVEEPNREVPNTPDASGTMQASTVPEESGQRNDPPPTQTAARAKVSRPAKSQATASADEAPIPGQTVTYGYNDQGVFTATVTAKRRSTAQEGVQVASNGPLPAAADDGTALLGRFSKQISTTEGAQEAVATLRAAGVTPPDNTPWEGVNTAMLIQLMYANAERFNNPNNQNAIIAV